MAADSLHYLYKITNLLNNKVYIGQTNNPSRRWSQHKSAAKLIKNNQIITKAIRKNGASNFKFEIIACCLTQDAANKTEEELICQYGSRNFKIGYNVDSGGKGVKPSIEVSKKISNSLKKYYLTHCGPNKGISLTKSWKEKISKSNKGKFGVNNNKKFDINWKNNISKSRIGKPNFKLRKFSYKIEDKICELYLENNSTYYLANKFNCYRSLIKEILLRNKITIRSSKFKKNKRISDILETNICNYYNNNQISIKDLSLKFKVPKTSIRAILVRNNLL